MSWGRPHETEEWAEVLMGSEVIKSAFQSNWFKALSMTGPMFSPFELFSCFTWIVALSNPCFSEFCSTQTYKMLSPQSFPEGMVYWCCCIEVVQVWRMVGWSSPQGHSGSHFLGSLAMILRRVGYAGNLSPVLEWLVSLLSMALRGFCVWACSLL